MHTLKSTALTSLAAVCIAGSAHALPPPTFNQLYVFPSPYGPSGSSPEGRIAYHGGLIYGTTLFGGNTDGNSAGYGTVFRFDPATNTETALFAFAGGPAGRDPVDMVLHGDTLYISLQYGGAGNQGAVAEYNIKTGKEKLLYSFGALPDAQQPNGLIYANGILYGTSQPGGAHNNGTVFSLDPKTGKETVLYSFSNAGDGSAPGSVLTYANGKLYGTTRLSTGTIFVIDPKTGKLTTLYTFTGPFDGSNPNGLTYAKGMLYGTTESGGRNKDCTGCGVVFSFNPESSQFNVIYELDGSVGAHPIQPLTYVGGQLYGEGYYGNMSVFAVDAKTGKARAIHVFSDEAGGTYPQSVILKVGKIFYGTTFAGGVAQDDGAGTIFGFTP